MESDSTYFARRAADERSAAAKAQLGPARRAHLELAERYDDLHRALAATESVARGGDDQLGVVAQLRA